MVFTILLMALHLILYGGIHYQSISDIGDMSWLFLGYLIYCFVPVTIMYLIYWWLYMKKWKKKRLLLSFLFGLIVTFSIIIKGYKNMEDKVLFIGIGIIWVFVTGILLDTLMKRLFKE